LAAASAAISVPAAGSPVGRAVGPAATDSVDEIHYNYGEAAGSVRVYWRGAATTLHYGTTTAYGSAATATPSPLTPIYTGGPFMRATLTGLDPGVTYHYRIGATGADHTLSAAPSGSFRFADIGDTGSTLCDPWMAQQQQLLAAQDAAF